MLQSMSNVWTVATQEEKANAPGDSGHRDVRPSTRRLVTLKPKEGFRLLFQQIGGLREAGDVFQFKKL